MHDIATRRRLSEIVEEYDAKRAAIPEAIADFEAAENAIKAACCLGGSYAGTPLSGGGKPAAWSMEALLLQSAWRHVYAGLQIDRIASAQDKRKFEQMLTKPPAFTLAEIRERFGAYLIDPRHHILRGLAEVFCSLDPAYRSHSKVKVGVSGLPKRVILSSVGGYGAWGTDRLRDILNALAAYQGLPLIEWAELDALLKDGDACRADTVLPPAYRDGPERRTYNRGVWLKRFSNGNGHLFFAPETLKDINRALAEFYGDVLPDAEDERPSRPRASTAVSRDLQYYPTPVKVAEAVVGKVYIRKGDHVLEPSCGCGRFMDAIRKAGGDVVGIEVDPARAAQARARGHRVQLANFLETHPEPIYDHVVMNPPFYGTHYAKHVQHALGFLKPGGVLTAILPASARYDHGILDGSWRDLPVGSFSESGTNVNTVVLTIRTERARAAA